MIVNISNKIDVYILPIPHNDSFKPLFPKERDDEVKSISNLSVKREKYYAWLLLEHALSKTLGLMIEEAELFKDENGKWRSPKCELSISHGDTAVAVAISHAPVGIDIEPTDKDIPEGFAKRFLAEDEYSLFLSIDETKKGSFLLTRWCMKEAIFKKIGNKAFAPSRVSTIGEKVHSKHFCLNGKEYFIAVAHEEGDISFFEVSLA